MNRCYRHCIKPILFLFNPSHVHHWFGEIGSRCGKHAYIRNIFSYFFGKTYPSLTQKVDGIWYSAPCGIAAGFDKDVHLIQITPCLGTGFHTIGSLTARPYAGNPGPWLVRLPRDRSILVNYGLKNLGIEAHINGLRELGEVEKYTQPVRISIAKTNCAEVCDIDSGISDYHESLSRLWSTHIWSVYELNISCPNAFGGEDFTTPASLEKLLQAIQSLGITRPIYLKMPVDTDRVQYQELLDIAINYQISGVIIANLTKQRRLLNPKSQEIIKDHAGGLSGKPTFQLAVDRIKQTYLYANRRLTIIWCGGVFSATDAYTMITHGASLIQLITGMIFEWPQLFAQINKGINDLLKKDGYINIHEAIGSKVK